MSLNQAQKLHHQMILNVLFIYALDPSPVLTKAAERLLPN